MTNSGADVVDNRLVDWLKKWKWSCDVGKPGIWHRVYIQKSNLNWVLEISNRIHGRLKYQQSGRCDLEWELSSSLKIQWDHITIRQEIFSVRWKAYTDSQLNLLHRTKKDELKTRAKVILPNINRTYAGRRNHPRQRQNGLVCCCVTLFAASAFIPSLPGVMGVHSAFFVRGDLDLWPWHSSSTERRTKDVYPVNVAQIRPAVPEIFDPQQNREKTSRRQR